MHASASRTGGGLVRPGRPTDAAAWPGDRAGGPTPSHHPIVHLQNGARLWRRRIKAGPPLRRAPNFPWRSRHEPSAGGHPRTRRVNGVGSSATAAAPAGAATGATAPAASTCAGDTGTSSYAADARPHGLLPVCPREPPPHDSRGLCARSRRTPPLPRALELLPHDGYHDRSRAWYADLVHRLRPPRGRRRRPPRTRPARGRHDERRLARLLRVLVRRWFLAGTRALSRGCAQDRHPVEASPRRQRQNIQGGSYLCPIARCCRRMHQPLIPHHQATRSFRLPIAVSVCLSSCCPRHPLFANFWSRAVLCVRPFPFPPSCTLPLPIYRSQAIKSPAPMYITHRCASPSASPTHVYLLYGRRPFLTHFPPVTDGLPRLCVLYMRIGSPQGQTLLALAYHFFARDRASCCVRLSPKPCTVDGPRLN